MVEADLAERLKRRVDQLPVLPTVVARLMMLDHDSDAYFDRVLELLESDPTFAARILAAANSAASGPRSPVTSVRTALTRLGSEVASNVVLTAAVSRVFVPSDDWERSLWRHAMQVASASRALCHPVGNDAAFGPDDAYAAGLLHDIGRFVMFQEAPDILREVDEDQWDTPEALIEAEVTIAGVTHGVLGELACAHWGLPTIIQQVALRHHEPDLDAAAGATEALIALIRFADLAMFPSAMPGAPGYGDASLELLESSLMPEVPDGVSLSMERLREVIVTTTQEVDVLCAALGIAPSDEPPPRAP